MVLNWPLFISHLSCETSLYLSECVRECVFVCVNHAVCLVGASVWLTVALEELVLVTTGRRNASGNKTGIFLQGGV